MKETSSKQMPSTHTSQTSSKVTMSLLTSQANHSFSRV